MSRKKKTPRTTNPATNPGLGSGSDVVPHWVSEQAAVAVGVFAGSTPEWIESIATMAALRDIAAPRVKFSSASPSVTNEGFVLHSEHIDTKWGFRDGDCPDFVSDMAWRWFNDESVYIENAVWHPILFHLVVTRLLPAVGATDAPVHMLDGYHHNPIRLTSPYKIPQGEVTVPWIDLLALVVAAMPDQPILTDAERDARQDAEMFGDWS